MAQELCPFLLTECGRMDRRMDWQVNYRAHSESRRYSWSVDLSADRAVYICRKLCSQLHCLCISLQNARMSWGQEQHNHLSCTSSYTTLPILGIDRKTVASQMVVFPQTLSPHHEGIMKITTFPAENNGNLGT